jgi:hypothetical protein
MMDFAAAAPSSEAIEAMGRIEGVFIGMMISAAVFAVLWFVDWVRNG